MEKKKLDIKQTSWNFTPLFSGDDDPKMVEKREEVKQANYAFINKWKDRTDYLEDPAILKEALDEFESLSRNYGSGGDEAYYFGLRSAQEADNTELKAKANKIEDFSTKIDNDGLFFGLNLAKIPLARQEEFLRDERLKDYQHSLECTFACAKYLLSEEAEKILDLKNRPACANWVAMTSRFLSREEREVIMPGGNVATKSFAEIMDMTGDKNKITRDSAAAALNSILERHILVAEEEINSVLLDKKIDDDLRGYERPDQSRHLADDVDSSMVDAVVSAVGGRFDIPQRYYELKAKILGLPILAYHERNVPYGKAEKKYSYFEAAEMVYDVFNRLDPEFGEIVKGFFENGHVDVFSKKGKASGAFCTYNLLSQPTYIFLNHNDELGDVLTLAHECGHGTNDELMKKKLNALNFGTPTSTAEVASTFMEDFVLEEILKDADDELRLTIMIEKLDSDISTIFRQVAFYKFEQELHDDFRKEGYLSKDAIGRLFQKQMAAYMGPAVEQSPGAENWWCYVSHFRNFFYVYSYASSLLISKSLQAAVKEYPEFISKVKEFLGAGCSDSPKNLFMKLGVDVTDAGFWNQGIKKVEDLLAETEALAKKLGKI
jgi:oligoendopeptidase F